MATPRTLTLLNPQTGETQIVPVVNRTIPATAFSKFKIDQTTPSPLEQGDTVPIRLYDPGFKNTAVCKSKISFVDGETGKLYYRGYDVEELVERSSYLEVSFLLIFGELPDQAALKEWTYNVMHHTFVHAQLERQMAVLRYDSHPMAMLIASIASLSTFHPEANPALAGDTMYMKPRPAPGTAPSEDDAATSNNAEKHRNRAIYRMLGKIPTIASHAYRHRQGRPFNTPMNSNNYCENLLYMMDNLNQADYKPNPTLVGILDKLFILLAASSGVDPYTALSGAAGTLFGERKSTAVIKMLKGIESVQSIPSFLQSVKDSAKQSKDAPPERARRPIRLMGFGHRIYQVMDPRAKIAKNLLIKIIDLMGMDSLTGKAFALEEQVLNDEWFNSRKLFPNVDYWLAIIFSLLDFPVDMFPVWMFIPRVSGLIAHLIESIDDPDYKIFRPRQVYLGQDFRKYESGTNVRQSMTAPTFDGKTTDSKAVEMRTNRIPRRSTSLSDKHQEKMDLLYEMSLLKVSLDHMATAMNISEEMPPAVSLSGSPSTSMRFGSKNLRSKSGGSAAELDTTDVSAANLGCYSVVDGRNTENETIARSAFCKIG